MKLFLLAFTLTLWACNRKENDVIKPLVQNITESVYASGVVKSRNQYEVFSTVNGIIGQQMVAEGDRVKKGDVLMSLLNEPTRLSYENARLAATYSSVDYNRDRLHEMKGNIDLALTKMLNDSVLFQRQLSLWNKDIGSRNELEQRELAWKNSVNNYKAALLQYNHLKKEIDFRALQSFKDLEITGSAVKDYNITARQDGRVYSILKQPGEMVTPQMPVALIGDPDAFVIELQVDEYDIGKIKTGQKMFVSLDSYKGQVFEASVTRILPLMDQRSRSFVVEATFKSRPPDLYPHLTIEANILISTRENALTVPRTYLVDDNFVLLRSGEKRKVTTGLKDYQHVEITGGLSREDQIQKPRE